MFFTPKEAIEIFKIMFWRFVNRGEINISTSIKIFMENNGYFVGFQFSKSRVNATPFKNEIVHHYIEIENI